MSNHFFFMSVTLHCSHTTSMAAVLIFSNCGLSYLTINTNKLTQINVLYVQLLFSNSMTYTCLNFYFSLTVQSQGWHVSLQLLSVWTGRPSHVRLYCMYTGYTQRWYYEQFTPEVCVLPATACRTQVWAVSHRCDGLHKAWFYWHHIWLPCSPSTLQCIQTFL